MMYLSKVRLLSSAQAVKLISKFGHNGAYSAHQIIWQLFRHASERPFIYREEQDQATGRSLFYVLSTIRPQDETGVFDLQTKLFSPQLYNGQRLHFQLRVNPTICVTDAKGKRQRHDVLMHAKKQAGEVSAIALQETMDQAAQQWLCDENRLSQWGITFDNVPTIEGYTQHQSWKKSGAHVQFSSVNARGTLTLQDSERFLEQYAKGFGRAKAMGCGLMLIRPA
ncbi:type I-E CRISPR-associated protein Cas6/Cse3/CasE [Salinivibrio costicola]|nr:type I-E CRISPR-associated protein Cas6/Cse3/CasE [Salinivibrio costicola]